MIQPFLIFNYFTHITSLLVFRKIYIYWWFLYFNELLNDWSRFDINKRTKYDATISSGLAIMACNRHLYAPNAKIEKQQVDLNFAKYNQGGNMSKIIKN